MNLTLTPRVTDTEFLSVFNRLSVALRETQDESGITQGVYFDALKDLPLAALRDGADVLAKEQGRRFFPTTAEWRTAAKAAYAEARRRAAASMGRVEPWKHECLSCEDTGWILHLTCDGGASEWPEETPKEARGTQDFHGNRRAVGMRSDPRETEQPRPATCGRMKAHQPHDYTRVCGCRPTNRTFQRHQAAMHGEG